MRATIHNLGGHIGKAAQQNAATDERRVAERFYVRRFARRSRLSVNPLDAEERQKGTWM